MDSTDDPDRIDIRIRARMARHVLPAPPSEIDARTGFILKMAGVLRIELPNQMPDLVLKLISEPTNSDRLSGPTEPALIFRAGENEHHLLELDIALLNPDTRVRRAVLDEIGRKLVAVPELCSSQTRRIISLAERIARSDQSEVLLRACLEIHDALRSDVLYNLALFRQACAIGAIQSALEYLNRLLRPMQAGLGCFDDQPLIRCLNGNDDLDDLIAKILQSTNVGEMLSRYLDLCGFVPLAEKYSCGFLLKIWRSLHPDCPASWKDLTDWADQSDGVLAQYQICQAVIGNQDLITETVVSDANERINAIVQADGSEASVDSWKLRQQLSRYYSQYLTCEFPGSDTERIAICAWWLADKLSKALENGTAESCERCYQHISQVLEANEELWLLVQPGGGPSVLFSGSMQHRRLWAESLTAEIAACVAESGFTALLPATVRNVTMTALGGAVFSHGGIQSTGKLKYSLEIDVLPFVKELREALHGTDSVSKLTEIVAMAERLRSANGIEECVKMLPSLDDETARVVAFAIQKSAFAGGAPIDFVWKCISDVSWRKGLVNAPSEEAFARFCETTIRMQVLATSEEWRIRLPHIFAIASIEDGGVAERVALLVSYCVVSSIAGGCTSAIDRLISQSDREDIQCVLSQWHTRLDQIIRFARPLAAARLRPIKQSLSAANARVANRNKKAEETGGQTIQIGYRAVD
jgi:hypothetical protein